MFKLRKHFKTFSRLSQRDTKKPVVSEEKNGGGRKRNPPKCGRNMFQHVPQLKFPLQLQNHLSTNMSGSVDLLSKTSCSFKILHHCPYQFYEALEQKQKRWQYQSTFTHRTEKLGEVHDRVLRPPRAWPEWSGWWCVSLGIAVMMPTSAHSALFIFLKCRFFLFLFFFFSFLVSIISTPQSCVNSCVDRGGEGEKSQFLKVLCGG